MRHWEEAALRITARALNQDKQLLMHLSPVTQRPMMFTSASEGPPMIDKVIEILRDNRVAAVATVDPDGWPHCTMVGIAQDGLRIYFVIARNSQKMIDINRDERISLVVGRDVIDPASIRTLAIKARASIVGEPSERHKAIELLLNKRPALKRLEEPNEIQSAVIVAVPEEIRLLDYSKGLGHSVLMRVAKDGRVTQSDNQVHEWGYGSDFRPTS